MSADRDSKVIGYYGLVGTTDIVCSGGGCLIAGSEAFMRKFVNDTNPGLAPVLAIQKSRFWEIVARLKRALRIHSRKQRRHQGSARWANSELA